MFKSICVFVGFASAVWAFPNSLGAAAVGEPGVFMELDRDSIPAGTPLLLMVTLRNESEKPVELENPFGYEYSTILISYRRIGFERWIPFSTADSGVRSALFGGVTVEPGSSIVTYVLVLLSKDSQFFFADEGQYELRAEVRTTQGRLESEPAHLEVLRPEERVKALMDVITREIDCEVEPRDPELESLRYSLMGLSAEGGGMTRPGELERLRSLVGGIGAYDALFQIGEAIRHFRSRQPEELEEGLRKLEHIRTHRTDMWADLTTELLLHYSPRFGRLERARELLAEVAHESSSTHAARSILAERSRATTNPSSSK
jgi:hypothetical protein